MRTVRELRALTLATGLLWFTVNVGWSPHSQEHHVIGCQERNEGSLFQENYLQSYSLHLTRIPIEYHTEKRMRTLKYFKINIIPLHVLLSVFPVLILKLTRQNENNFRKNKIKSSWCLPNRKCSHLAITFEISITKSNYFEISTSASALGYNRVKASTVTQLNNEEVVFFIAHS